MQIRGSIVVSISARHAEDRVQFPAAESFGRAQCYGLELRVLRSRFCFFPKVRVHKCRIGQIASAGNRTRVTSMATMYSTTRPLMLIGTLDIGGRFLVAREVFVRGCGGGVCMKPCGGASRCLRMGCWS